MNKNPYTYSDKTQVHMTTVYSRRKSAKRTFSFVINSMLISSVLLGAIALSRGNVVSAATSHPTTHPIAAAQQIDVDFQDEQALIANLSLAVRAIKKSGLSAKTLMNLMNGLESIDAKVSSPEGFINVAALKPVLLETEQVVTSYGSDGLSTLRNGQTVKDKLTSIKRKIGMEDSSNSASPSPVSKKNAVKILSADELTPSVVIDGVKQSYPQPPVIQNGSTLVPLRGIFESLGAAVSWSSETETVTATKGSTEISLKVGSNIAYVNGKQVKLATPSVNINGFTMVPLRFVSEAFGGSVKWDNATATAYIETAKGSVSVKDLTNTQKVNGINVKYGKHTYGVQNQSEYDEAMKIVFEALKGFDDVIFGGDLYSSYYYQFMDGARWSGDIRDRSDQNRGLKSAENSIGDLVKNGVKKDEIVKVYKTMIIAGELIKGSVDPRDASPSSIYDTLIRRVSDCDSDAQTYSAVFDGMGYNTMIIGGAGHAEVLIQIDGSWYETAAGSFRIVDVEKALENGSVIVSEPTFGAATIK